MAKDYYEVLGVPKNATAEQIKKAYREQVLKYHPDVNKDPKADVKMRELNEAYAVLGDAEKRQRYDSYGPEQFGQQYSPDDIFRGFNTEDIFKDLFGFTNFGDFNDAFQEQNRNEPTGLNLYFPFTDLEKGVDKEFEVQHYKRCDNCRGSGGEPGSTQTRCPTCNGTGSRNIRRNTILGTIQMSVPCDRCRGRGRIFAKACSVCNGSGQILVKDRFRVRAEKTFSSEGGEQKKKRGFFS